MAFRLKPILKYARPYRGFALLNILFNVLTVIFNLFSLGMIVPFLELLFESDVIQPSKPEGFTLTYHSVIDHFYYFFNTIILEYGKYEALIFICIIIAVLFFLKNLFRYLALYFIAPLRNNVIRDIRNSVYQRILILPLAYFSQKRKGDIMARISNDVQEIEWSIMNAMVMIFRDPLAIALFLFTLLAISAKLTLFVVIFLPITGWLIGRIGKTLSVFALQGQKKLGGIVSLIEESINGLRIIKAYNVITLFSRKFREANLAYTRLMNRIYRKRDLANPLTEFLAIAVLVVILWFGGKMVLSEGSGLEADVFIFYLVVFSQIIAPAKSFIQAWYNIEKGIASVERVEEIMNADEVIEEKDNATEIHDFKISIEYRNVFFRYETAPVLKNINLSIAKGKRIAIVGPSGSGKSTMLDLLPRFYDCTGGTIMIDGRDIKDYRIDHVRGMMGIVTQETILFNDTVFNNIAFGLTGFHKEQVVEAAKAANAHEFISDLPLGYHTNIGDMGTRLSGGQRQRISIARAILRNPPLLLLDEATSSLDTESEKLVQQALENLMENRTSVIIAHRLSTIVSADEIIVLSGGEIIERGTHNELIRAGGFYHMLTEMQSFKD